VGKTPMQPCGLEHPVGQAFGLTRAPEREEMVRRIALAPGHPTVARTHAQAAEFELAIAGGAGAAPLNAWHRLSSDEWRRMHHRGDNIAAAAVQIQHDDSTRVYQHFAGPGGSKLAILVSAVCVWVLFGWPRFWAARTKHSRKPTEPQHTRPLIAVGPASQRARAVVRRGALGADARAPLWRGPAVAGTHCFDDKGVCVLGWVGCVSVHFAWFLCVFAKVCDFTLPHPRPHSQDGRTLHIDGTRGLCADYVSGGAIGEPQRHACTAYICSMTHAQTGRIAGAGAVPISCLVTTDTKRSALEQWLLQVVQAVDEQQPGVCLGHGSCSCG
jgi:hypothetical protein